VKKQYVGIVTDNSMSMGRLTASAAKDYNNLISAIQTGAAATGMQTIVSVVGCGHGNIRTGVGAVKRLVEKVDVSFLGRMDEKTYVANGHSTPLYDSVGELINQLEKVEDYANEDVSFLISTITDGEENSSSVWKNALAGKIASLQNTGRWTFVFRVPTGKRSQLDNLNIFPDNICEWDLSTAGLQVASAKTEAALSSYFVARSAGAKSTNSFYSDMNAVKPQQVAQKLTEITKECTIYDVEDASDNISQFVTKKIGKFWMGIAFYELIKTEKVVQDRKVICIRDKKTKKVYSGAASRALLGLPSAGDISLSPGCHGQYSIFIQSTSANRKLPLGSKVLIWEKARII